MKLNDKMFIRPISPFDGRRVAIKRGKKIAAIIGKLIILLVTLSYVFISCYKASRRAGVEAQSPTITPTPIVTEVIVSQTPTPTPSRSPVPTPKNRTVRKNNPAPKKTPIQTKNGIYRFIAAYPKSRINKAYADQVIASCGNNIVTAAKVIAIATAETGMGRDVPWKTTNFYGWYPNKNKAYDPSLKEMADVMCAALGNNGAYKNIGYDYKVTSKYTGADRTERWIKAFLWAMQRMTVEK